MIYESLALFLVVRGLFGGVSIWTADQRADRCAHCCRHSGN
jgi:hypothetical protein